jgi:hypothetical protein|tara:strand:+ start:31 stop:336 length:306 start_codon:yes stop_codon:yes gene_type:complete
MRKQYTIEFEPTHNQWIIINDQIRSHDPDANYGYYYHKTDAKKVADMLNQRVELTDKTRELLKKLLSVAESYRHDHVCTDEECAECEMILQAEDLLEGGES